MKAFDTATGAARWELRLPGETPAAVVVAGDAVVVLGGKRQAFGPGDGPDDAGAVGSTRVTALDAGTGQVRWVASAAGGPQQLTVADDLVVAHVTGGLYGFERATGAERWRQVPLHEDCWELRSDGAATTFRSGSGGPLRLVDPSTGARTDIAEPVDRAAREVAIPGLRVWTLGRRVTGVAVDGSGERFDVELRALAGLPDGTGDLLVVPTALSAVALDPRDGTRRWTWDRPLDDVLTVGLP